VQKTQKGLKIHLAFSNMGIRWGEHYVW